MDKTQALLISLLLLGVTWWFTDYIFNFEIGGFDLPIFGYIDGFKPLAGLIQYSGLIVGGLSIIVFYLLSRRNKAK